MSSLTVVFKIYMCVFRPVLQRFGSYIAHVLHVKASGSGSSANKYTAALGPMGCLVHFPHTVPNRPCITIRHHISRFYVC